MSDPISLHPYQKLVSSVFFILAILLDVKWYLIMALICISIMANGVEPLFICLFICLFPYHIPSLVKCLCESFVLFLNIFIYLFIYLFLAALGLHCCTQAFSSCGELGLLFIALHRLLIVVASLVVEHRL